MCECVCERKRERETETEIERQKAGMRNEWVSATESTGRKSYQNFPTVVGKN